jgi:leucyl aminopeptidase (aminopeptidase T)
MSPPAYATNAVSCLTLRPGERFWMICDEAAYDAGLEVCRAAHAAGAETTLTVLPEISRPLTTASAGMLAAVEHTDAILLWEGTNHPVETVHRRAFYDRCAETGCRIAFGANIDAGVLEHEMAADYAAIAERCRAFADALVGRTVLRVTAVGGTDLTMRVDGREWKIDDGRIDRPGQFANLPAGEIFIAPVEDSAEGLLVVDRAIAAVGPAGLVDEPVRIEFRAGRVVDVQGGEHARAFRDLIQAPGADVIAELGIGTNERARLIGNVMTDEKVLGSAHVAVGYNRGSYGGLNDSAVHCDGCFADATIEADGRVVIERGQLVGS